VHIDARCNKLEADPEADVSLPNCSGPEEDNVKGFSVQPALRLGKAGILAEVDELKVVHAQLVNTPAGSALADTMVLAIYTETFEALLQCGICLKAYKNVTILGIQLATCCVSFCMMRWPWLTPRSLP